MIPLPDQQQHSFSGTSFIVSLISNVIAFFFGSKQSILNPALADAVWSFAISLPYAGPLFSSYLNAQILLAIISFIVVWIVAMSLLGLLGRLFGSITPLILILIGALIAGVFFGVIPPITARKLLP